MFDSYANQADIPEAFREHYSRRDDGKWHADISNEHPAVKQSAKLLGEKKAADEKVTTLESELESAKAGGLPRGHVPVPKSDAELLEKVKAHGSAEEVTAKLEGYGPLKEAEARRVREQRVLKVAELKKWDGKQAVTLLADHPDMPETEIREGKVYAKVTENGVATEKSFEEVFEKSEKLKALERALASTEQGRRGGHPLDPMPSGPAGNEQSRQRGEREARRGYSSF